MSVDADLKLAPTSRWWSSPPRVLAIASLLTLLLGLGTLDDGFIFDDHLVVAAVEKTSPHSMSTPFNVYRFATGDVDEMREAIRNGDLFWWTDPAHLHNYWRPVTSAIYVATYAVFGRWPTGYRIQNFLWYLAFVTALFLLLRRILAPGLCALTIFMFVICDAHAIPIGSISSLHHFVAAALVFFGLLAHLRWREDGWRRGAILSLVAFGAGLLAGESGLQAMGYLLAYELIGAPGSKLQRLRALVPAVAVVIGFLVVYKAMGSGVKAYVQSDAMSYADPFQDPIAYLRNAALKLPYYLALPFVGGFRLPIGDFGAAMGPHIYALAAGAMYLLFGPVLWFGIRALPEAQRRAVRWILLGTLFALAPAVATSNVTEEAYLMPSLGGALVAAIVLAHAWHWLRGKEIPKLLRVYGGFTVLWLTLIHALLGPCIWRWYPGLRSTMVAGSARPLEQAKIPDSAREIVLLTGMPSFVAMSGGLNAVKGRPQGQLLRQISPEVFPHTLKRTGARSLELIVNRPPDSWPFTWPHPLTAGLVVEFGPVRITVVKIDQDGAPIDLALDFDRDLTDPSLAFLRWEGSQIVPAQLPPIGEQIELPAADPHDLPEDVIKEYFGL